MGNNNTVRLSANSNQMKWPKAEEEEDERAKSEAALILLIPADGRREIKQPTNAMCCIGCTRPHRRAAPSRNRNHGRRTIRRTDST